VRIVMGAKGDFFSPKSIANRQKVCVWGAHRASVCLLLSSALLTSVCLCSRTQHVQAKGLQKLRWYCQARAPPRARRLCSPQSDHSLCHCLSASLLAAVSEAVPRRERVQVPHDE